MNPNIKIVSLSANIAAGKSLLLSSAQEILKTNKYVSNITILGKLKNAFFSLFGIKTLPTIVFIHEPTNVWIDTICANGKSIFENYYTNPNEWSFRFQLMALVSRIDVIKSAIKKNPQAKVFVIERSPDDDFFIFANKLHGDGFISDDEMMLLDKYRAQWTTEFVPLVQHVVYLNTSVEICLSRKNIRCRIGENGVDEGLLESVGMYTSEYIAMMRSTRGNNVVIELNGALDKDSDEYMIMVCKFIDCCVA